MSKPSAITTEWVKNFSLAQSQPEGLVSVLRWLGVIDEHGDVGDVWNELRTNQGPTLERLVRSSYSAVFDAVDVATADREMLDGAFITAYETGNTSRPVGAFIALCELAGISVAAATRRTAPKQRLSSNATGGAGKPSSPPPPRKTALDTPLKARHSTPTPPGGPSPEMRIAFNIEIPAEWSAEQVTARVRTVLDALSVTSA